MTHSEPHHTGVPPALRAALEDRYRIEREIGAGGMATVYLARDVKHDRRVALKVLKPELGAVLGVERFLAEIRVTANLQHPNLLPLFDSGEAAGLLFYVMPYIQGESLRARLDRETVLPVDEAVRITIAMAAALDYAHRQDVVHRDLKPENVLLHEGQPLIADFGIALAVTNAGGARLTQTGLSLGTPHYMSPEQAMGEKHIDRRSDIYALAAVAYELLAGEPPHSGPTAAAIIARVVMEEPRSLRAVRVTVPEYVQTAIDRGLAKQPADRWATAREFAEALAPPATAARAAEGTVAVYGAAARGAPTPAAPDRVRRGAPWAIAAVAAAAAVLLAWNGARPADDAPVVRMALRFDAGVELATARGTPFALSPDGRLLAFAATRDGGTPMLFVRAFDELEARALPGTEEAQQPFFSPDGEWIGYYARQELRKVPSAGGASVPIGEVRVQIHGASWGTNGEIIVSTDGALAAIPAVGGVLRSVSIPDSASGETQQRFPLALADGRTILYESWGASGLGSARIGTVRTDGSAHRILDLQGSHPLGMLDGALVYAAPPNRIFAVPFDARRATMSGAPVLLVEGAAVGTAGSLKGALSRAGALVYASSRTAEQLVLREPNGTVRTLLADARYYENPRFSPDGRRVALTMQNATSADLHLFDLTTGAFTRFTSEGRTNDHAQWSPDGKRIVFVSNRSGQSALWWGPVDQGQAPEQIFGSATTSVYDGAIAPDGRTIVARTTGDALWYRRLSGDTASKLLIEGADAKYAPRISPDGKWVAYSSSVLGTRQVFVTPLPGPGPRIQISIGGGEGPVWAADGRRLFYVYAGQVLAASIAPRPEFTVTSRTVAVEGEFNVGGLGFHPNYDVSPDGRQFLLLRAVSGSASVVAVIGWKAEVRARLAASVQR